MENTIILATTSESKIEDMKSLIKHSDVLDRYNNILTIKEIVDEYNLDIPVAPEEGSTVEENCLSKITFYKRELSKVRDLDGCVLISEDTGLFIKALDGAPGVHTARYAGDHDPKLLREKIIEDMKGKEDRLAFVKCAMACTTLGKSEISTFLGTGSIYGYISETIYEGPGFSFDNIFIRKGDKKTVAEMINKRSDFKYYLPRYEALIHIAPACLVSYLF